MSVTPLKIRFGKLLKDCLKNTDYRQNDLAARLQVTGSAVSQMMHGKIVPNQQQLDAICEMLALDRAKVFELNSMLSRIRTGAENMLSPFNQTLFALRCQRGLSLQQLSNLSGVSVEHLRVFETCFEAYPTLDEVNRIAPILDCSPAALLQSAGVGGLNPSLIAGLDGGEELEAMEYHAPYHAERQIPLLQLTDLDRYDGTGPFGDYANRHALKVLDYEQFPEETLAAIHASGRDLTLGIPGTITLILGERSQTAGRGNYLCRSVSGRYSLQEERSNGRRKEYRIAGTRKLCEEIAWQLPVFEISLRPGKSEARPRKSEVQPEAEEQE